MNQKQKFNCTVGQLVKILKSLPQDLAALTNGYEDGFENIYIPEVVNNNGAYQEKRFVSKMTLAPTSQELNYMDNILCPLIDKIILNNNQIRVLENLRDTLLPKLMSGEVRVKI